MSNIIAEIIKKDELSSNFEKFNAGFTKQNFTKKQIVEKLLVLMPNLEINYIPFSDDKRNYRVNFSKIENFLKIKNKFTVPDGFQEILDALKTKEIVHNTYLNYNLDALTQFYKKNSKKLLFK